MLNVQYICINMRVYAGKDMNKTYTKFSQTSQVTNIDHFFMHFSVQILEASGGPASKSSTF